MITSSNNSLCQQANLYYYDFLFSESRELIPQFIVDHLEHCQHCEEQVSKLKAVLSKTDNFKSEQEKISSAVATMLKLHFAYVGKPVTCNVVKPFLPSLLDPALGISIPTPIVTHLYNCQKCSEDLDIIRSLGLNRKQLCRLSQLFADKPSEDEISCSEVQNAIPSIASMAFSETDSEVLKHVCKCPVCRDLLYQERQKICDSLPEFPETTEFPCDQVSTTDIFDYVVPYGLDPASDQYAKFRKSLTSHIIGCPNCLARMQQLHKTIYYVAERAESDVVTIYEIDESAKAQAAVESDLPYSEFPIKVKVIKREDKAIAEHTTPVVNFAVALKQRILAMKLKPLVKTVGAAAAVILIAVALLFHTPTAKAVTIERIYKAIETTRNVYISKFAPDRIEPEEEKWISRELDVYIRKTGKGLVLVDIPNRIRKIRHLDTESIEIVPLSSEMAVEIEKMISGFLGLVPFSDLSVVPDDAEWNYIAGDSLKVAEGIEAYDLIWTEKALDGSMVLNKWRVFVDTKTDLPQRTELYRKQALDSDYTLESVIVVEYLERNEIESVIKDSFF